MERIASFCVDHTKLDRGMYLSRQDGDVLTWDIRMKRPNHGDYLSTGAAHTLEHLFATYARNSAFQDSVIYVGPMGCRTGFYLLTRGLTPAEALELTVESFRFMAGFEGAVPGASEVECGNYRDMDLPAAKAEAPCAPPARRRATLGPAEPRKSIQPGNIPQRAASHRGSPALPSVHRLLGALQRRLGPV